jgi:S-formylglutathione hydrolase
MPQAKKISLELQSEILGESVPATIILPPDYTAQAELLPLFIELHGAGGDRDWLDCFMPMIDGMYADCTLPSAVVVTVSAGPLSFYAGDWPRFIAEELPQLVAAQYRVRTDRAGVVLVGVSMGGHATLKIGFRYPERFAGIAALEPAIEPFYEPHETMHRNTWYLNEAIVESIWGSPLDAERWKADHAPNIAVKSAQAIRNCGLEIYLECGDEDRNQFQDGSEFLHRVLWDLDIRHEYHLVRWANHMGPSLLPRMAEAHAFLAAVISGERCISSDLLQNESETAFLDWSRRGLYENEPMPEGFLVTSERAPSMHAQLTRADYDQAVENDPEMARSYARLPLTREGR